MNSISIIYVSLFYILRRVNRIVYSNRQIKKDYLFIIAVLSTLIVSSSSISNYSYFDVTKVVYGQSDSS